LTIGERLITQSQMLRRKVSVGILRSKKALNAWRAGQKKSDWFADTGDINHLQGNVDLRRIEVFVNKWFSESIIGWGVLFVFVGGLVASIAADIDSDDKWVEFWGLIFDVIVIVVILGIVQLRQEKKATIARQHETIEDYKRWNSEEAVFRVAGALRRLNRLGVAKVDLSGANLSDMNLSELGVESIAGSVIGGGAGLEAYATSKFERCDFFNVDCRGTRFSRNYLNMIGQAEFYDCSFYSSAASGDDLFSGAVFDGATLSWSREPIDDIYSHEGYNDDGSPILLQEVFTGFMDTDISQISFRRCKLKNADFRGCSGVEQADFHHAQGLESCKFDTDELKELVIKKAAKKKITKKADMP